MLSNHGKLENSKIETFARMMTYNCYYNENNYSYQNEFRTFQLPIFVAVAGST